MADNSTTLPAVTADQVIATSGVDQMLSDIRPEWRAKSLIERVKKILPVDPSSACQRLLNAAIHDLREKIIIAGLDVAQEAASRHKLPSVAKPDDVYELSTTHTLDLAYRMGLTSRPDWRRLKRAYDIRKDLEHEDDQYEAEIEDCVYVFRTCIGIVLSRDPIAPVRVVDVKDLIEAPARVTLSAELIEDFQSAPDKRQEEIIKFLVGKARDGKTPDIVRQNAIEALRALRPVTRRAALAAVGTFMQANLRGHPIDLADMKIAGAAGFAAYLKQARVRQFLENFLARMNTIGYRWDRNDQHGPLFDDLEDIGGFESFPPDLRSRLVRWMVLCYIGEPGGYGMGVNRPVFYSNSAAPRIGRLVRASGDLVRDEIEEAAKHKMVKNAVMSNHVARRLERLRDLALTGSR